MDYIQQQQKVFGGQCAVHHTVTHYAGFWLQLHVYTVINNAALQNKNI